MKFITRTSFIHYTSVSFSRGYNISMALQAGSGCSNMSGNLLGRWRHNYSYSRNRINRCATFYRSNTGWITPMSVDT